MNVEAETEQLQNFHGRLSQWVSSQGFWFQLRYSLSGGGSKGALTFHFFRLAARLAIFAVVVTAGVWVFLVRQTGTDAYANALNATLKKRLGAEEIELKGFDRQQGEFSISRAVMKGSENTFFTGMELRNLKCQMGLLDAFREEWDPGLISISRANLGLRAGSDSLKSAEAMADVYFQDTGRIKLTSLVVNDISIDWGYSERNRGNIRGSKMRAQRIPEGWRLRFRGGTFTQNWLKRLEIQELDVVFGRQGMVFEKAVFRKNQGYITFDNLKVKSGERPEVSGTMNLRKVDVSAFVPIGVRSFVEGTISGEFKVFGSTNSVDGVGFEGKVEMDGEDMIVVRDRIHLLRALSVVDAFNTYRRVNFRDGSFHLRSHGGRLQLTDVNLRAGDLFSISGEMTVRPPTAEEAAAFDSSRFADDGDGILNDDELDGGLDITLERAARQASEARGVGFGKTNDDSLFERLGLSIENRRLEERAAEQLSRSYRYEGRFTASLPKDAFEKAPKLEQIYPARGEGGRILVEVPLEGVLYDLTLKQADEIYTNGTR